MLKFFGELLLSALALFLACYMIPGVSVTNFWYALLAAILIGLANASIGFVLRILTFLLNWHFGFGIVYYYGINDFTGR